jgi:hypothetical protein
MGILLGQVVFLKTPYENYTPQSLREKVYDRHHRRPPIPTKSVVKDSCNSRIATLLEVAWHRDFQQRPTMEQFAVRIASLTDIKVVAQQLVIHKGVENVSDLTKQVDLTVQPPLRQEFFNEKKCHEAFSRLDEFEAKRRRQGSFDYSAMDVAAEKAVPVRLGTKRAPAPDYEEPLTATGVGKSSGTSAANVSLGGSLAAGPLRCVEEDYDPAMYFL